MSDEKSLADMDIDWLKEKEGELTDDQEYDFIEMVGMIECSSHCSTELAREQAYKNLYGDKK